MRQFKQNTHLRIELFKLRARNFFLLKDGDSLKAITLRRKILESKMSKKAKLVKKLNIIIRKHVNFAKKINDIESHPEDY
ncbi:MAG: hypothetical protein PHP82_04190 [Candidatus ainarchaeum sp.]|nr:hypothetical protein [Candidatus ainarchaeum sp.]